MTCNGTNGTSLAQLQAPRRNRYFYGKLLDVLHLTMEQQYTVAGSAHVNRLNFGPGVMCGLGVTPINLADAHGVHLESGVAFDGLGRRIVVPDAVEFVPLELTDACGMPVQPQPDTLPASLVLSICYRECQADFAPALVPDPACNGSTRCEAGTWVESYSLSLREPTAAQKPVTPACRKDVMASLKAGDLQGALCAVATECRQVQPDICVPLAAVKVAADKTVSVPDPCPVRPIVPTNLALLELIACLAQRVEECCRDHQAGFKIDDVAVGNARNPTISKLSPAGDTVISTADKPTTISITFVGGNVDEKSVAFGSNVMVVRAAGVQPTFDTPGVQGTVLSLKLATGSLSPGAYTVTVSGDPPSPLKSTDGDAVDATGDGSPGGVYSVTFKVQKPGQPQ